MVSLPQQWPGGEQRQANAGSAGSRELFYFLIIRGGKDNPLQDAGSNGKMTIWRRAGSNEKRILLMRYTVEVATGREIQGCKGQRPMSDLKPP